MIGQGVVFVKNLLRSSLDNYVLPGTCAGTEILWLYFTQWKRGVLVIALATFYTIESRCELERLQRVIPVYRKPSQIEE